MAARPAICESTVKGMLQCSTEELEKLYAKGRSTAPRSGATRGTGIYFPGTWATQMIAKVLPLAWSGKTFDGKGGAVDRFLPFGVLSAVQAKVSRETSVIDGADTMLLTRTNKWLFPLSKLTDEFRLVAPDLYMGPVLAFGKRTPIWYTLEYGDK